METTVKNIVVPMFYGVSTVLGNSHFTSVLALFVYF